MIILLTFLTGLIALYSVLSSKLKCVSLTFITSLLFFISSFIYSVTYQEMLGDISFITVLVITLFLLTVYFAESISIRSMKIPSPKRKIIDKPRYISAPVVILLTLVFLLVAFDRFNNLRSLVSSRGGNANNIMTLMSQARMIFIKEKNEYVLGNFAVNQLVYFCEICTYICIYFFFYNYIVLRKKKFYYLLPLIPQLIISFLSTSRTGFILLLFSFILSYVISHLKRRKRLAYLRNKNSFSLLKQPVQRKVKKYSLFVDIFGFRLSKTLAILIVVFVIVFFIYGRIRNEASSIPLLTYLQMYTSSSIFGLNQFLTGVLQFKSPYFGYYTLQDFYSTFGIKHSIVPSYNPNFVFSVNNGESNIYTSLVRPIVDYGIIPTFILRFLAAFITVKLLANFVLKNSFSFVSVSSFFFVVYFAYCFFYSSTGDSFGELFLSPLFIVRNLLYSILFTLLFVRKPVKKKKRQKSNSSIQLMIQAQTN